MATSNRYSDFKIIRPLYTSEKEVSSTSLKVGDRFIYDNHETLMFKTNTKPVDGKYLCCNEAGTIEWIDGKEKVIRINGIVYELQYISRTIREMFPENKK